MLYFVCVNKHLFRSRQSKPAQAQCNLSGSLCRRSVLCVQLCGQPLTSSLVAHLLLLQSGLRALTALLGGGDTLAGPALLLTSFLL